MADTTPTSSTPTASPLWTPGNPIIGSAVSSILAAGQPPQQTQQVSFQLQQPHPLWPNPDAVRVYEQVHPGAFDRILTIAEQSQRDQTATVQFAQQSIRNDTRRGHWLGWSLSLVAFGCAITCVFLKQPWVAGAFLSVPVSSVAKALVDSVRGQPQQQQIQQLPAQQAPQAPAGSPGPRT